MHLKLYECFINERIRHNIIQSADTIYYRRQKSNLFLKIEYCYPALLSETNV